MDEKKKNRREYYNKNKVKIICDIIDRHKDIIKRTNKNMKEIEKLNDKESLFYEEK